jgi:uncharacterized protein YggT (Ycf19 family)
MQQQEVKTTKVTSMATSVPPVVTDPAVMPPSDEAPHTAYKKRKVIFKFYQILWYILGVIEVLLAFRFALKLMGASPYSPFVQLINIMSAPFAEPFRGVLPINQFNNNAIEWSTLIAMVVWLVITWGLVALAQFIKPTNPNEVVQTVDSVDSTPPAI